MCPGFIPVELQDFISVAVVNVINYDTPPPNQEEPEPPQEGSIRP